MIELGSSTSLIDVSYATHFKTQRKALSYSWKGTAYSSAQNNGGNLKEPKHCDNELQSVRKLTGLLT